MANAADVSRVEGAGSVIDAAVDAFGDLHIVVNNAGTVHDADVDNIEDACLDGDFSVNVKGTAGTVRAAFRVMKEKGHGGSIINTMTGFGGLPAGRGLVAYNAAKYAVVSYTLSAAAAASHSGFGPTPTAQPRSPDSLRVGFSGSVAFPPMTTRRSATWVRSATLRWLSSLRPTPRRISVGGSSWSFPPVSTRHAKFVIKEAFVAETDGAVADAWLPDDIERAIGSIIRGSCSRGCLERHCGGAHSPARPSGLGPG